MKRRLMTLITGLILALAVAIADAKTLSQAVDQVRNRTDGKVLSAKTVVKGDKEVHVIKVLTKDGRVKTHQVQGKRVKKRPNETTDR